MSKGKPKEAVKVCVRMRPFNSREKSKNCKQCIKVDKKMGSILITKPATNVEKTFTYDAVYDPTSTQLDVYKDTALPIVDSVLEGYNGTVFAYGQTGAGKTYSMQGSEDDPGLIPNCFEHIFHHVSEQSKEKQFLVTASMLEIYNEEIRDLLGKNAKKPLQLKESKDKGVYVKDLSSYAVKSVQEITQAMKLGRKNRSVGKTEMNAESSRSHCIFMVKIETSAKSELDGEDHIRVGKLNMVDLAGSERAAKTGATGERLLEGCKINLSLSALGNVIKALVESKSKYVPYRDSKLTRILQDSLGGNTKTVMLAAISPADDNYDETLSTLRYASRAKKIQNKPTINEDPKDAMLREYQEEIKRLQAQLSGAPVDENGDVVDEKAREAELRRVMEQNKRDQEMLRQQMSQKTEEEKSELLAQQEKLARETSKIEDQLKERQSQLNMRTEQKQSLAKKLQEMQAHVVRGGKSLLERNEEQERKIAERKSQLEEKKRREMELKRELQMEHDEKLRQEEQYDSLQDEIDLKTKKLKKLWQRYQSTKQEIDDLMSEFQLERDDFSFTIRELEREIELKNKIMDHFVPLEEVEKVKSHAVWNDEIEDWIVTVASAGHQADVVDAESGKMIPGSLVPSQMIPRPISAAGNPRPISDYARKAAKMGNSRFKQENVITLELEMPDRTTEDFIVYDEDYEEGYDDEETYM